MQARIATVRDGIADTPDFPLEAMVRTGFGERDDCCARLCSRSVKYAINVFQHQNGQGPV
ncbi:hypothetical protein ABIA68_001999 [Stenotrophomonas rhizophila]|uniref:hypothetical protein n=1 Tax=Stenotrophomonas rhizophila TaxID=216778 RepID=UPI003399860D